MTDVAAYAVRPPVFPERRLSAASRHARGNPPPRPASCSRGTTGPARASDSARGLARGQQQPCGHGNAAQLSRGALTAGRRAEQGSVGFLTQKQGCCRLRPGRGAGFLAGADADAPGPAAGAAIAACATAHTPLGDPCAGAAGGGAASARAAAPRREPAILVLRGASCHGRASAAGGGRGARRATQKTESPQWPESPLERRRAAARRPRRAARRASGPQAAPPGRYFAPTWRPARAARRPAFRIWPESPRQLVVSTLASRRNCTR